MKTTKEWKKWIFNQLFNLDQWGQLGWGQVAPEGQTTALMAHQTWSAAFLGPFPMFPHYLFLF